MPLLRLTQHVESKDNYRVEIALEGDGPRKVATAVFDFALDKTDQRDFRWYLEDYLDTPFDPNPKIADRIEGRMIEVGKEIFGKVFKSPDAVKIWNRVGEKISEFRIEIVTDVLGANAIPWELICDTQTNKFLALNACEFVRSHPESSESPEIPQATDVVRILLAICRPREERDVPFRSVAGHILRAVQQDSQKTFELRVLRPPTFENLGNELLEAKRRGQPYHIVHFDGHGAYLDIAQLFEKWEEDEQAMLKFLADWLNISTNRFSPEIIYPNERRNGERGYLIFENPESEYNLRLVDGPEMGSLLKQASVPILVLNACRSAHSEPLERPDEKEQQDIHSQVRTFGSFAQEVSDNGVAGVVAMRYNVFVETAAKFVANLYNLLAKGVALGEAVTRGRQSLRNEPARSIGYDPVNLQDWVVPIVYEAESIRLLQHTVAETDVTQIEIDLSQTAKPADDLPRPDVGFYGRDETLLALDRAFDTQKVVLLHAYAGSGKTMTAAEFARWYQQTGGLDGPILFTSFEQKKTLDIILNEAIGQTFGKALENIGIHWNAPQSDDEHLNVTLQVLKQIPVLWIWDNVEPVNGFPSGAQSAWTEKEQRDLKNFLQNMGDLTKARFLLTSRRDERAWLGDLPRRVSLPPMPKQEMVQLARALAEKQGKKMSSVGDWMPLLDFTRGNPMTLTVLVGQALRDGLNTKAQVYEYVNKLRTGEAKFEDEKGEGREKSLGASLSYGFETAFTEEERKILALLHFFQGFVHAATFMYMGFKDNEWHLPELEWLTKDSIGNLLDRASEIGLLTAHGGGYYTIHPALPWFFGELFEQYYPAPAPQPADDPNDQLPITNRQSALRAFVEAIGALGDYYHDQYEDGNREVIAPLRAEEANLLHARALALSGLRGSKGEYNWAHSVIKTMQGLDTLYAHTGRRAEWQRLVEEILPDFVGPDDLPRPGREAQWSLVTQYRVLLAQEERNWAEAERLQRVCVDWDRRNAAPLLARPPESLDAGERNTLRTLAVSMEQLGQIQREIGMADCAQTMKEAIPICQVIDDKAEEAILAFNLGHAYMQLPALRDLDQAERWYRRSLELLDKNDRIMRGRCTGQLGLVAYERFNDAKKEGKTKEELLQHLNTAADYYRQALALQPPDAVDDLAVTHNQLGNIYGDAGNFEQSIHHHQEAAKFFEAAGALFNAAIVRRNLAISSSRLNRLPDALLYARAALRNFEAYQGRAGEMEEKTRKLIADIERLMGK
ncbi:MAG: CHAT domain-containing tetratricopeptide repeat protein [Chloroflexota bacterium]